MLKGLASSNPSFLADLNRIEDRISRTSKQITSGVRVNEASDDPSAIASILEHQNQINQITQVQSNLNLAKNDAQTADGALQTASSIMNQLLSMAAQGANGITTASTRTTLGEQVQQLEQQLVSIANTTVGGRYIFGGDDPATQPYTFNWTSPGGVVANSTPGNTIAISDAGGSTIIPGMTAQQIFDSTPNNVFQAVYALGQALLSNNQAGIESAIDGIKSGAAQIEQATASYGNTEAWIEQVNGDAAGRLTNLTQALSTERETDIVAAATQLTTDQTALEASLAAHASLNQKSLFSYFG
jgi:flagellar hook-associated protein 3 FlgL